MCGILGCFLDETYNQNNVIFKKELYERMMRLYHRGPDAQGLHQLDHAFFCHTRLAIIDVNSGAQPFLNYNKSVMMTINGEIYNHVRLEHEEDQYITYNTSNQVIAPIVYQTRSDCEIVMHLWERYGPAFISRLQGDFAFAITNGKQWMIARDPIGVCPLYIGRDDTTNTIWFSSEMKALLNLQLTSLETFPPGHYYTHDNQWVKYYDRTWMHHMPVGIPDLNMIRKCMFQSVARRLMSDVPFACLLSGGLDSSIVVSVANQIQKMKHLLEKKQTAPDQTTVNNLKVQVDLDVDNLKFQNRTLESLQVTGTTLSTSPLVTFCVGFEGESPDRCAARRLAEHLGTDHHDIQLSVSDAILAIEQVIYHLETYDVTTIRASTPMYMLSKIVREKGYKMVLSGEGSDELMAGYLYFHHAPDARAIHHESAKRVQNLHVSDCLRANKSTSAHGLEIRVPFLDKDFIDACFSFDPVYKMISPKVPCDCTSATVDKDFCMNTMENNLSGKYKLQQVFEFNNAIENTQYCISLDHDKKILHIPSVNQYCNKRVRCDMEKWILRMAFQQDLPDDILWRQKEQFSDGVGYHWIDSLIEHAKNQVSDALFETRHVLYPYQTPQTKEAFYYRQIFQKHFPDNHCDKTVACWTPTWSTSKDPSGRVQHIHVKHQSYLN